MEQVHVREACSEVLIFIDRNVGSRLIALEEADKILQREILREKFNTSRDSVREVDSHKLPRRQKPDGLDTF